MKPFGDRQPRCVGINDEGGNPLAAAGDSLPRAGKDDIKIRDAAIRNPHLLAIQPPAAPFKRRGTTGQRRHIRACIGFG